MKTEINGDWIGYLKRFKMPSRQVLMQTTEILWYMFCCAIAMLFIGNAYTCANINCFVLNHWRSIIRCI